MAKEIGKVEKKSRKSGAGSFFLGGFIGFLMCLATIAGLLCFVYFKVSPNFLNKTFKTDINLGSEEANKKTVKDFVAGAIGIIKNADEYTLTNLNDDFGIKIKDEMFGIKIKDLKNVALTDLADAVEKKFGSISADELRNVNGMNLDAEMGKILNKEQKYYYNHADYTLYSKLEGSTYSKPVSFEYVLNANKDGFTVKDHYVPIVSGEAKVQLWYLPLTVALGDFTDNLGDNITLYDLEQSYGVKLPKFFKFDETKKKETTINELQSAIDELYVADFLGYTIDWSHPDKIVKKEDGTLVEGFEATIAKFQINGLAEGMSGLKLSQIFKPAQLNEGVLSLIDTDPTIEQLPSAIATAVKNSTIQELIDEDVIVLGDGDSAKLTVSVDHDKNAETDKKKVAELTMSELLDYCFDLIPNA